MDRLPVFCIYVLLLFASAWVVFRLFSRKEYKDLGRLRAVTGWLELVIFLAYVFLPFVFCPPCWLFVWDCPPASSPPLTWIGYGLVGLGAVLGFGAMIWLGILRSFGQHEGGLNLSGPYRFTRNPQVFGGTLMVSGIALLWPSWYALGWVVLWFVMFHMMVITEEEHLSRKFGEEYQDYCLKVPRYIRFSGLK